MHWVGRVVALAFSLVLVSLVAVAQDFPQLERDLDHWRNYRTTERVMCNRERCRDAITGRLSSLVRHPWRLERDGFKAAYWDLYGDDFNIVGVVYVEKTLGLMSMLDVWCEFASDGEVRDLHLKIRR